VAELAKAHGIPVLLPAKPAEILDELKAFGAEAAVLVAYGKIIPQSVIDIFPKGIINIHPSLLPKHRGPTPLESVILQGEDVTGVSVMSLAKEMDAGPVYAQSDYRLTGAESKQELADTLLGISAAMLLDILPGILDGSIVAMPQDHSAATYDRLITKEDAILDFSKPAEQLVREVRAYQEWPKSRTTLGDIEVVITQAHTSTNTLDPKTVAIDADSLAIGCSKGCLCIDRLIPAGKKEMSAAEFIRGYGSRLTIKS
jgi:methionyl-tRNA formyltransferase